MSMERVEFSSFSLSDRDRYALNPIEKGALVATETTNCHCFNGRIESGVGIEYILNSQDSTVAIGKTPQKIVPAFYESEGVRYQVAVLVDVDGVVWIYNEKTDSLLDQGKVAQGKVGICIAPTEEGDAGAFIAARNAFWQTGYRSNIVMERLGETNGSVCVFKDRVFYSSGRKIRFSNVGRYTDFADSAYGGGTIEVWEGMGNVLQLLPYGDAILLFKDRAILKLYAAGAADQFRIERLDYNGGRIASYSAAQCGKYVLFTTSKGDVYCLDGSKISKIATGLPSSFAADDLATASDGENYFRSDSSQTLVMNPKGESYFAFRIEGLTDCDGSATGVYWNSLCRYNPLGSLPYGQKASFKVQGLKIGNDQEKIVRRITVYGQGSVNLTFAGDRDSKNQIFKATKQGVSFDLEMRGEVFDLTILLDRLSYIDKIAFEFNEVGGGK